MAGAGPPEPLGRYSANRRVAGMSQASCFPDRHPPCAEVFEKILVAESEYDHW